MPDRGKAGRRRGEKSFYGKTMPSGPPDGKKTTSREGTLSQGGRRKERR